MDYNEYKNILLLSTLIKKLWVLHVMLFYFIFVVNHLNKLIDPDIRNFILIKILFEFTPYLFI